MQNLWYRPSPSVVALSFLLRIAFISVVDQANFSSAAAAAFTRAVRLKLRLNQIRGEGSDRSLEDRVGFPGLPLRADRQQDARDRCLPSCWTCGGGGNDDGTTLMDRLHNDAVQNVTCSRTKSRIRCEKTLDRRSFMCVGTIASALLSWSPPATAAKWDPSTTIEIGTRAPFSSRRSYRVLTLPPPSGLRVLLASDVSAVVSTAALSIGGAGQFDETPSIPGLAHLAEHVTLTSRGCGGGWKYGRTNDFEGWLSDHDGSSNAFTSHGLVCFHFDCPPEVLPTGLDRFASLFRMDGIRDACLVPGGRVAGASLRSSSSPYPTDDADDGGVLEREVHRVDAEFDDALGRGDGGVEGEGEGEGANDMNRYYYLLKHLCNPRHPFHRMSAGNADTLLRRPAEADVDLGAELWRFFETRYVAENAVLVVAGPADLASMERWVVGSGFGTTLSRLGIGDDAKGGGTAFDEATDDSTTQRVPDDRATKDGTNTIVGRGDDDTISVGSLPYPQPFPILQNRTQLSQSQSGGGAQSPLQIVVLSSKSEPRYNKDIHRMSLTWPLDLIYDGRRPVDDVYLSSINDDGDGGDATDEDGGGEAADDHRQQKRKDHPSPRIITAPAVAFVVAQVLARQGPGSLYLFLLRRGWVPRGTRGVPRITLPVDVSGFQLLKMEFCLTTEGFGNRSAVIAAIYRSIRSVSRLSAPFVARAARDKETAKRYISGQQRAKQQQSPQEDAIDRFLLPMDLLVQYVTVGTLHGYKQAPRPSDAVEMAVDSQTFGVGGKFGVGVPGVWPLLPPVTDRRGMDDLRNTVASVFSTMHDPATAIVVISASAKVVTGTFFWPSLSGFSDVPLPPISSGLWEIEPVTGARYIVESGLSRQGLVDPLTWVAGLLGEDEGELEPPVRDPLVPARLRPARPILARQGKDGRRRFFYRDVVGANIEENTLKLSDTGWGVSGESAWREFFTRSPSEEAEIIGRVRANFEERALALRVGKDWSLWQAVQSSNEPIRLPLPLVPPEPNGRCAFLIQLLSKRPSAATATEAAHAQLWLNSFDEAIIDLAELGAPAGLAYESSFNSYGLRICFRGISQSLPSYARRFCRRLVEHHVRLRDGTAVLSPYMVEVAVSQADRWSTPRSSRDEVVQALRDSTARDAAADGVAFLSSCGGGISLAQGDLLPNEAIQLLNELQSIFGPVFSRKQASSADLPRPELQQILYRPLWKPRSSSSCYIPGVCLLADACGRVPR